MAPSGVSFDQFQAFIDETRASLQEKFPHTSISNTLLAKVVRQRAQEELNNMSAAENAEQEISEDELAREGVIHDEAAINESLEHGFDGQD